jgi:cytochrome c2
MPIPRAPLAAAIGGALVLMGLPFPSSRAIAATTGDPAEGAQVFRACAACHSLKPGEHRTGPSLAGLFGRKAGTVEDFRRYSPALKAAEVVCNEGTLDPWITDPQAFIPGNRMAFRGLPDAKARAALIAYLAQAERQTAQAPQDGGMMGGMGGASEMPDLKTCRRTTRTWRWCARTTPFSSTNSVAAGRPPRSGPGPRPSASDASLLRHRCPLDHRPSRATVRIWTEI